jgi:hypothetical protein
MTKENLYKEVEKLEKFFVIYCNDKHKNINKPNQILKTDGYEFEFELCDECFKLIKYSIDKLDCCTKDPKPKCRVCPDNCYEKEEKKQMSRVMRHSGMKLGLNRIKKMFFKK